MRGQIRRFLMFCTLACAGCSQEKSTDELIADLKSGKEEGGVIAARSLPLGRRTADKVIPALIGALKHPGTDVRRSSALKLSQFREQAKDAIPTLLEVEKHDRDARVREAAAVALSRIDPEQFPNPHKIRTAGAPTKP